MIRDIDWKFPEKWAVIPKTTEEARIIGKWFDENHGGDDKTFYQRRCQIRAYTNAYNKGNVYNYEKTLIKNNIPIITFEEFKKYVLGEEDKPKFEVGKWYKKLGLNAKYYGKLCGEIKNDFEFPCKEYFVVGGKYNNDGNYFTSFKKAELLTDLSEIQQYLPAGHPDAIPIPIKEEDTVKTEWIPNIGDWVVVKSYKQCNVDSGLTTHLTKVYDKLSGESGNEKAEILYNQWNKTTSTSLVGRWLKCIKENDFGSAIGSYLQITDAKNLKEDQIEGYISACIYVDNKPFAVERIGQAKQFELMPEGFDPNSKNEFKKDDYIVLLVDKGSQSYLKDHCYKQKNDYPYLLTYLDSGGSTTNGWIIFDFKSKDKLWRYATIEEVQEYNRLGKPYNIYSLKSSKEITSNENWCVKTTPDNKKNIIEWAKSLGSNRDGSAYYYGILNKKVYYNIFSWGKLLTTEEFYQKIGHNPQIKVDYIQYEYSSQEGYCNKGIHTPHESQISINDVFKSKPSVRMSYITEETQKPRQLEQVKVKQFITI